MARDAARQFMKMLVDDPELRRAFAGDPQAAIAKSGLSLDPEDAAALQTMDLVASDGQLRTRLNRQCGEYCNDQGGPYCFNF